MSKPPPSVSHKTKPTSAGGKKDSKKQAEDEQQTVAPPPPPPPLAPFDMLHEVWSLPSLRDQRHRISVLFGLSDCPAGCLCFARVLLDETFHHLRFASTLALSPVQARFVHQLISTFTAALQLPDERWSTAALSNNIRLLLATNCVHLLPGTSYIDTTHLLPPLDLPPVAALSTAASDGPTSTAVNGGSSSSPATSRPSSTSVGKRPPPSTRNKPAAPPSPQQQPIKPNKPLTAKEKEAAAAAERAANIAAAEAAAAEAAALAALPPVPPTPPPHFLTVEQMERVWRYVAERLLIHSDMYRSAFNGEERRRREADRADYVWRRVKQQPDSNWVLPLHTAVSEQPITDRPVAVAVAVPVSVSVSVSVQQAAQLVGSELTLHDGDYSAEERAYLLQMKAEMEQQLQEAAERQRQQQQTAGGKAEQEESKEQLHTPVRQL